MTKIQSLYAAVFLTLTALVPGTVFAQSTNPDASPAKIAPGSLTPNQDPATGTISSQSADTMQPAAHEGASRKAKTLPSSQKHKAVPVPAPKPIASP